MHLILKVGTTFALALIPAMAIAQSSPITSAEVSAGMPESVRVQPRARTFIPDSAEEEAVQNRLTIFNQTQAVQDAWFDRRRLTICRGC
jgi:hypothetical protein